MTEVEDPQVDPVRIDRDAAPGSAVPYMSYTGFRNLLDRLRNDGVPQVFDTSFFGRQSGSLTAQTRGTLRFLDLIDDGKRPTPLLRKIVAADDAERIQLLRELGTEKYGDVIKLAEANGTQGQLAEVFRARGVTGATVDKATVFYVGLAEHVGLSMSPFFKRGSRPASSGNGGAGTASRRTNRRRKPAEQTPPAPTTHPPMRTGESALEEKKLAYIDMLMKLVERGSEAGDGTVQGDLLNRLEKALGYAVSSGGEENERSRPEED